MRACVGVIGLRQLRQQPLHFVPLQRHVHFDGGVARDRRRDAGANLFQIQRLLLAGELVQQLVQHFLDHGRVHSRRRHFHRHAARAEWFGLESIALQFVRDFGEHRPLRRRQLQHNRHQQPLAFDSLCRALLQYSFKQHALVGDVLVYDPQPIFVHRQDERVPNLSQRLECAERSQRRHLLAHIESRSTPIVRNGFDSARQGNRRIGLHRDPALKLKSRGNRRRHGSLQSKSVRPA